MTQHMVENELGLHCTMQDVTLSPYSCHHTSRRMIAGRCTSAQQPNYMISTS